MEIFLSTFTPTSSGDSAYRCRAVGLSGRPPPLAHGRGVGIDPAGCPSRDPAVDLGEGLAGPHATNRRVGNLALSRGAEPHGDARDATRPSARPSRGPRTPPLGG